MEIENISEDDKSKVHQLCQRTEDDFNRLIEMLDPDKYPKARVYTQNLSKSISTFFQWWLEKNEKNWKKMERSRTFEMADGCRKKDIYSSL